MAYRGELVILDVLMFVSAFELLSKVINKHDSREEDHEQV